MQTSKRTETATRTDAAGIAATLRHWIASYLAGGTVLFIGGVYALALVLLGIVALLVLYVLAVSGAMKWIGWFLLLSVPVGVFVYFVDKAHPDPIPEAPRRRRSAGIHGDACYADFEETRARGLIQNDGDFSASVYLGEYLDWYTPEDEPWLRTGFYLGYTGENNILTVAPAGSGKFTTSIAQTLLLNGESMFVMDVKGESYAVTARCREELHHHKIVAINPFDMFGDLLGLHGQLTAYFNPLAGLDASADSFTTHIDALASAMIVQEGNDPHWSNRARDLVACLMAHVCSDPAECAAGNNTLPRVRQILGLPRDEFAVYMLVARETNPLPRVQNLAGGFADPTSKEIGSIISTAIGQLSFLDQPMIAAFLSRSTFDFSELRTRPTTIYFMLPPNELNTYYRFARLIVQACFNALSVEPKPDDRRVLLLLDEQAQLKHMDTVANAIALLRGYKVRIWSIFQDLNQLESIYKDRWESFVANAGIVQVFTTNDEKTARYFSAKVGNYTGTAVSTTTSTTVGSSTSNAPGGNGSHSNGATTGTSLNLAPVPFLSVHDFYSLNDWHAVLFVRGSRDTVPAFKAPYWEQPVLDGIHRPNPYHDPQAFRTAFLLDRALAEAVAEQRPFCRVECRRVPS